MQNPPMIEEPVGYPWELAFGRMQNLYEIQTQFQFIDWCPLYDRYNLNGIAQLNATRTYGPAELLFYQNAEGNAGADAGFPGRRLRLDDTNLQGKGGEMPGGQAFVGKYLCVFLSPDTPPHIKDWAQHFAAIRFKAQKQETDYGAIRWWPSGPHGHVSPAVDSNIAGDFNQYGVNGLVGMIEFPLGSEILLPEDKGFSFRMLFGEQVFITTDGEEFDGENGIEQIVPIEICMYGWLFSLIRPG